MRLPIAQIDAFASKPFEGNPAAVMPLAEWLDDRLLQAIAAENNLSETAYIVASNAPDTDYDLRWFTPTTEVVMCGHATLASGHFILSSSQAIDSVRFRTRNAGILEVRRAGAGYDLSLPAWVPSAKPLPEIVTALGLKSARDTLWHDHRYALIVLDTAAEVRALEPDFRSLTAMGDVLVIASAPGDNADIISRAFAAGSGINEDPVTGSAHAVLVPYWANRLKRSDFTAFQASRRGGHLTCRLEGDSVILGGRCVTLMEGTFLLD